MAGIPAWAVVAAAPKLLNDYVVSPAMSIYGAIKDINTQREADQNKKGALDKLRDYTYAMDPEDYDRINADTTYGVNDPNTEIALRTYSGLLQKSRSEENLIKSTVPALKEFSEIGKRNPDWAIGKVFMNTTPGTQAVLGQMFKGGLDDVMKAYSSGGADATKVAQEKANREAATNLDYIYREKSPLEQYKRLGELADVTGASSEWVNKQADDLRATKSQLQQAELAEMREARRDARTDRQIAASDARQARSLAAMEGRAAASRSKPQQSMFVDEDGTPLLFDPGTSTYFRSDNKQPAKKPSRQLAPEQAAKMQLIDQALSYVPQLRTGYLGVDRENPVVNRINVANSAGRIPFTEGRELSTLILDAVEAKLRAESGAAVPETEVKRIAKRYIPQVADKDTTVILKINNLEQFLSGAKKKMISGRGRLDDSPKTDPLGIR